jgi:ParB-like chromosome segregation protein Spo0J
MKVLGTQEIPVSKIEVIQGLLPRVETHTVEDKVEEYKEAMELGSEFPPITVWQKDNEYWLIDGMHRLLATKRLGREAIKAEVVELKDMLEAKVLAITKNKHGLPLTKEEKRLLCQSLYIDGVEISELMRIFGVSERTVYNWTSGLKRREKPEDIREKALEMRRQGYTQEQVARELGVDQKTISNWERDSLGEPAKIAGFPKTPTPSEEETDDPVLARLLDYARRKGIPEDVVRKGYEDFIEEDEEFDEFLRQKREEIQKKRSNGGRPPNDPPPATEEELYESLKADLTLHMNQIALKIGWAKALPMFEEVLEEMRELSKIAKRGW